MKLLNTAAKQEGLDLLLFKSPDAEYHLWGEVDASASPGKIFYAWVVFDRRAGLVGVEFGIVADGSQGRVAPIPDEVLRTIANASIAAINKKRRRQSLIAGSSAVNRFPKPQ